MTRETEALPPHGSDRPNHRSTRAAGFTLIELMITIVIATILISIAMPMYLHQIRESRRTDARSALLDLAAREERYFATNNQYSSTATDLGYQGFGSSHPVGNGQYYYIDTPTVKNGVNPPSFELVAHPEPSGSQAADADCTSFTVDSTGAETATGANSSSCWQ